MHHGIIRDSNEPRTHLHVSRTESRIYFAKPETTNIARMQNFTKPLKKRLHKSAKGSLPFSKLNIQWSNNFLKLKFNQVTLSYKKMKNEKLMLL